jgi:hypothetical protein
VEAWPSPELLAVYDPTRAPSAPEEDPQLWANVPADELRARQERLQRHQSQLAEEGVYGLGYSASGDLRYFAMDQQRAESLLAQHFGSDAGLRYLGASMHALRPHPFGSWQAEDQALHLFYALPNNGEEFAGCIATEREDCVIIALSVVDWLGYKTLIGGFTPSHVTVMLDTELGARPVIDNFDNRVRPHWKTAAEIPLPRPQDR